MVQTSATPGEQPRPRRRRMSADLRSRLEQDVAEIRAELSKLATKEDLEEVKREILEAIGCRVER